jgi:hypothetical protein
LYRSPTSFIRSDSLPVGGPIRPPGYMFPVQSKQTLQVGGPCRFSGCCVSAVCRCVLPAH